MDAALVTELVSAIAAGGVPAAVDGWRPSVQGAVGHVVGVRIDGRPAVLKIYALAPHERLDTERLALAMLSRTGDVPVPLPLAHGTEPRCFLLMSRLFGVRWADRRPDLDEDATIALTQAAGRLLRRLHRTAGRRFGVLAAPTIATATEHTTNRAATLLSEYVELGGARDIADRVRGFVAERVDALATCDVPVLCHNDFIDGNLLITPDGEPRLCGVVDFERASWGDPMSDLAQTRLHVHQHCPEHTAYLTSAYGIETDEQRQRLDVYELLHAARERSWIVTDQPFGWQVSARRLDDLLRERT